LRSRAAAAAVFLALAGPAAAQVSVQADVFSRYVWRGFDLFPPDNPAFQPSLTYTLGETGFSANIWSSFALGNTGELKSAREIDLTLAYAFKVPEKYSLSLGFIHYGWYFSSHFQVGAHTTQEFYLSAGLSEVVFQPSLTLYYDVNLGSGFYALLEAGHTIELGGVIGLELSAALGYNSRQFIDTSGFSDLTFGARIPFKIGERLVIAPQIDFTHVFLRAVNPDRGELWFGASVIY
jgi:uncharacterized protein (TIGR02001 family)